MKLAEKIQHVEDVNYQYSRLIKEFKNLQDQHDEVCRKLLNESKDIKETELEKENKFLKTSLESLGLDLIKLNEIKQKEFRQRDYISKYQ